MKDLRKENKDKLDRLNLPDFKSKQKVMILDKYAAYSIDCIEIEPIIPYKDKHLGMHGTYSAQVIKIIGGDDIEFYTCRYYEIEECINFCIENNIKIISASINFGYSEENEKLLKKYYDWGGIFVTSAGNEDESKLGYSAKSPYTLTVSATNTSDCDGPQIDVTADSYWYVRNKNKGMYHSFNGTSCSCPDISGCVALMLEKYPKWNLDDVRRFIMKNSSTDKELYNLEEFERFFSFPDNIKLIGDEVVNKPDKIIIHHSLTEDSGTVSWDAIRKYHIETQGWKDIGYHWGIEKVGSEYKILKGRDEKTSGAHTVGQNSKSIGICCVGNFDIKEPPKEQLYKLIELIDDIKSRYGDLPIYTHNHFASYKSCPGTKFPFKWLLDNYKYSDNSFNQAINKLVSKGIINSPDYWINSDSYELDYFKLLINNFAKQGDFRKNIEWMHKKGVINSKDYWLLNNTYSMEYCKLMIEKIAKFV